MNNDPFTPAENPAPQNQPMPEQPYQPMPEQTMPNQPYPNQNININMPMPGFGPSFFDGGLLGYIGNIVLGTIITTFTFGICYPWALCLVYRWKINHTVIGGRRLQFNGSAVSLFGNWIIWLLLCVVTLGIYSFWLHIALENWKVKNTTFAN